MIISIIIIVVILASGGKAREGVTQQDWAILLIMYTIHAIMTGIKVKELITEMKEYIKRRKTKKKELHKK